MIGIKHAVPLDTSGRVAVCSSMFFFDRSLNSSGSVVCEMKISETITKQIMET